MAGVTAGRAMDMSYKRAWDLVDEINRICRQAAVERQTGGKNGVTLTEGAVTNIGVVKLKLRGVLAGQRR